MNKGRDRVPAQAPDYSELKRHLQKTLKYPAEARDAGQTGFSVLTFSTSNRKITNTKAIASMAKFFEEESIRAINSFKGALNVPDGKHSIGIFFKLLSSEQTVESSPSITPMSNQPNYAGVMTVYAMGKPGSTVASAEGVGLTPLEGKSPEFEGGAKGWANYLKENFAYPKAARDNNISGRVIISMMVEKDGSLSDVKVLRGVGGGLDEEAIRLVKSSPKWIPGTDKDGQPVKVAFTLPISFALAGKKP